MNRAPCNPSGRAGSSPHGMLGEVAAFDLRGRSAGAALAIALAGCEVGGKKPQSDRVTAGWD